MAQSSTDDDSDYFVAHVKIERVIPPRLPANPSRDPMPKRKVEEVTQLTVKASTMAGVIAKLEAHIGVIGRFS